MKAYEALGVALRELGATAVFGVLGDGNLRFGLAARNEGVEYVAARHEASAVAMADAFARVSGDVGVATVTTGPGVTNTITALREGVRSRTPLVLITGAVATSLEDHPQLVDQEALVQTVGVGVVRYRSSRHLVTDLVTAFRRASSERRPIMFAIPTDLQDDEIGEPVRVERPASPLPPLADPAAIEMIVDCIKSARRPIVLAGWGAYQSGAGDILRRLGTEIDAVLATTALAKGLFNGMRSSIGVSGGFASRAACDIAAQADLVLAFGASLNRWTTRGGAMFPEARVIQVDTAVDSFEGYLRNVMPVLGDARSTAAAVVDRLDGVRIDAHFAASIPDASLSSARAGDGFVDESRSGKIDPRTLTVHLRHTLPAHAIVVQDSGAFVGFPGSYYEPARPGGYLFVQGFQTMGLGLGQAIGVALADRSALPVTLIGDGGLLMSLGELETMIRLGRPQLVVVYNDSAYGAEIHIGGHHGFDTDIVRFPETDFADTATALGGRGIVVRSVSDLHVLSEWLVEPRGLLLLDCRTDPEIASPFLREVFVPAADAPRARTCESP